MPSDFGDKPRTLSEEYDVEVVCQYTNEIVNLSHEEIFNSDEPYYHHQEALTPLITALQRTDAGSALPPHLFGHPYDPGAESDAVNFDDVLETVQEFCNSRN